MAIDFSDLMPGMIYGEELTKAMTILPEYDNDVRLLLPEIRVLKLMDIYSLFLPSEMASEIYRKIYSMTYLSLKSKSTVDAVKRLNSSNFVLGVATGATSTTVIGPSGIGKTSSIKKSVELINSLIETENPYRKIIPILEVSCPFDASYKGLLLQILIEIDAMLKTDFYERTIKNRMNSQQILSMVCNLCNLHIGMLIIDEVQFMSEQRNAGPQLLRMILQLSNQSGINIMMVGTPECIPFFQKIPQIARRAAGLNYDNLKYDDYFKSVCKTLFDYQYVKEKTEISENSMLWLYEHTNGNISTLISLIHDAQEFAITKGIEKLNHETLNLAYKGLSMLHPHIQPMIVRNKSSRIKKTKIISQEETPYDSGDNDFYVPLTDVLDKVREEGLEILAELKKCVQVVEVKI